METILIIMLIVTGLAYLSQQDSINNGRNYRFHWDIYLVLLFTFLILFAGLRTSYNDTATYAAGFQSSETIRPFLTNRENIELLNNPLFYGFQAFIRTFTANPQVFFMICAIIVNYLNLKFIKTNVDTENFAFTMFLYVGLGTLMLTIAAQKQTLAMAVLTLALSALIEKKYVKYYIILFLAGLIHTYAWLFLFLPLMDCKPWTIRSFILLFGTVLIMYTFQSTISTFVEVADQIGKNIPFEEVFDGNSMNILRVAVYSIVPLTSLFFKGRINSRIDRKNSIFIQMSTISMLFMLMGTMNGANMFGRCANYFEIGMICVLPWLVKQLFTKQSATIVLFIASVCFTGFYIYDNQGFNWMYQHKSITQFISEII